MPRLKGSADLLEDRRRRALALWDTGLSLNEVGRRIQCAPSSVLRWLRARRRGGPDALRVRFSPGRPLKLGASQRRRLVKVLLKGPQAHGYRTQLWTTARIAEVIGLQALLHPVDSVGGHVHYDLDFYRSRLDEIWDIFGPDRLLYGSDWPNSDHSAPLWQELRVVREYIDSKGAAVAEEFFWRNSIAAYRWIKRAASQPASSAP